MLLFKHGMVQENSLKNLQNARCVVFGANKIVIGTQIEKGIKAMTFALVPTIDPIMLVTMCTVMGLWVLWLRWCHAPVDAPSDEQ